MTRAVGPGHLDSFGLRSLLPLRRGRPATVLGGRLTCSMEVACEVRLELRVDGPGARGGTAPAQGTLLGSQAFTVSVGRRMSVDLRLSSAGLRIVRRHRALRVRVVIASQFSGAEPDGYLTVLRSPSTTAGRRGRPPPCRPAA